MVLCMEKVCFKCSKELPLSDFYKHSGMADGHLNKCKNCTKSDVKNNRAENSEYYKAYDRVRGKEEQRKENTRSRQKINKEKHNECSKKWCDSNRIKRKCHLAVQRALKTGVLPKLPCFVCGETSTEAHHSFYDTANPLDVTWLCVKHHKEVHRKYDHNRDLKILDKAHQF